MANNPNALTDMWMMNPYMFDPTQKSNQFSQYNNAPLPWPPTYNEGTMGGPVNAATGQPIQSYQTWKQQNPGGVTLNATPAQPAPQPQSSGLPQFQGPGAIAAGLITPQQQYYLNAALADNQAGLTGSAANGAAMGYLMQDNYDRAALAGQQQQQQRAAPQASGPPNNWQAAINALANPGNPVTQGATVPMSSGFQPAGGVNQAWLQQAQGRPNLNQGFLQGLQAIQNRPQQ